MTLEAPRFGPPSSDRELAALAALQHGVVSREQLRGLGLSDSAISQRCRAGRLHRLHQGVYSVGHAVLGVRGRWMAAVLACGPGAALSHASAAALWEIRASDAVYIDVTARRTGRKRPGLRIHRPRTLPPNEVTDRYGIPTTTPARTILDLAATLQPDRLNRVLDRAERQELTDYPALDALASAHPGHRGAAKLTRALRTHTAGAVPTRSELERRFLALCEASGLEKPHVNDRLADLEVDFIFRRHRLAIETDSWEFHRTRQAFERDRRRDAILTRAGYRTLRFTHRQITSERGTVAATIAAAMSDRRAA
jgi:very-short-patch-repair endonuclease